MTSVRTGVLITIHPRRLILTEAMNVRYSADSQLEDYAIAVIGRSSTQFCKQLHISFLCVWVNLSLAHPIWIYQEGLDPSGEKD